MSGRRVTRLDSVAVWQIEIYLNKAFTKVHISKCLEPIETASKQGHAFSSSPSDPTSDYATSGNRIAVL
jgi:hypothetical protein